MTQIENHIPPTPGRLKVNGKIMTYEKSIDNIFIINHYDFSREEIKTAINHLTKYFNE